MANITIWAKEVVDFVPENYNEEGLGSPTHSYLIFEYDDGSKKILRGGPGPGIPAFGMS